MTRTPKVREYTLTEYQTCGGVRLSLDERRLLKSIAPSVGIAPSDEGDGVYELTPGSVIGTVQTESLSLVIRPKLPIDRVLFLVSYAISGVKFQLDDFGFGAERDLIEVIIPGFLSQVRKAFRPGLLQGYRSEETALQSVRGRIRFEDQLRDRYGIFPPAEVRFDDFTEDIELNRLIKAAIRRLRKLRIRSDAARNSLRTFDGILSRVTPVEYNPTVLPSVEFTRLNSHYRPAIQLAKFILRSSSFELRRGDVAASAFLIDMNDVFEDFVVEALRDELALRQRSFPQNAKGRNVRLDEGGRVKLEPDISWWDGNQCSFVGDVKYKKTVNARVPNADLYQLLAYTTATNLPGGLLIYAKGEDEPVRHKVRFAGKELEVVALDLSSKPEAILGQIRSLARRISYLRDKARFLKAA